MSEECMGLDVDREEFEPADYEHFARRVREGVAVLGELLSRPGFGAGPGSIGAELELCLVDAEARPLPINRKVLVETLDPRVQLELDRFNLEYNSLPVPLAGRPFTRLGDELRAALSEIGRAAAVHGGRVATIGILPTLRPEDLESGAMSDVPRYRALAAGIRRLRSGPFQLHIDGDEPVSLTSEEITFEGANTSLQIHLRVPPERFARTYNAAQLATPLAVAVAANSPILLGHLLWDETRIALFKQVVDDRGELEADWRPPARVSFGHGWVREGALELFRESVSLFPPLLPLSSDEDPRASLRAGRVPALPELRLHHGTVWRWNRAVYDDAEGGHLRIELRALPAGPTVSDMLASAAFLIGLTLGLADEIDWMMPALPFELAERNFYRAAKLGLEARLLWPQPEAPSPRESSALELICAHLETARRGLASVGVESAESTALLDVIAERARSGRTGAAWQRSMLRSLRRRSDPETALRALTCRYLEHSRSDAPVHLWPDES
jgi:gamma-glutamyl:cysteine ligase YbdK (ATP-grasp superfamily)